MWTELEKAMFHLKLFKSQQAEENIYINKPQVWKYLVMLGGLNISFLFFFSLLSGIQG